MKNPNLVFTNRLPTVKECEKCKYQNDCEAGKYCIRSRKKGMPQIYNTVGKRAQNRRNNDEKLQV